jgi:P4 family phage/plasmid primase-like protien
MKTDDLSDLLPLVHTAGLDKGRHYYAKIPKNVNIRKKIPELYPGIDFLTEGAYVLIAGCVHPDTGLQYQADPMCATYPMVLPDWLLDRLQYGPAAENPCPFDPDGTLSLDEIRGHLAKIPATGYRDYQEWLKIGMAIHAASGGDPEAEELWVSWSTSDPLYSDAEEVQRAKWASFNDRRSDGVTAATLVQAAMSAGGSPHGISAELEFKDVPIVEAPSLQSLEAFLVGLEQRRPEKLSEAIKQARRYGLDNWDQIRKALRDFYRPASYGTIDQIKRDQDRERLLAQRRRQRQREQEEQHDAAIAVADRTLDDYYGDGELLVHATNQQFYHYCGTHWEPLLANVLQSKLLAASESLQDAISADPDFELVYKSSTVLNTARDVLVAKQAQEQDIFRFVEAPPSVVNTRNKEIWIAEDGSLTVQDHRPDSYLLSRLEADYDSKATCEFCDEILLGIFRDIADPEDMVRHYWEMAGYLIQPRKNIPSWWMMRGGGNNGKTVLARLIIGLVGKAVLPRAVSEFADVGRNNHSLTSLVGKLILYDDDADANKPLPESVLKKLAKSEMLEANPKKKDTFNFICCATPLILINDWPPTRDLSFGFRRRAFLIPLPRRFSQAEEILEVDKIILAKETPGVLNKALTGLRRLRKRGHFLEPKECLAVKDEWLQSANPIIGFIKNSTKQTGNGSSVALGDVYREFTNWCRGPGGVRSPLAQHRFAIALQQLGYTIEDTGPVSQLLGVELLESEI